MMSNKRGAIALYLGIAVASAFVVHVAIAPFAPACAQENPEDTASPSDVMKAYLELSKPGPEHKKLGMRVGSWKVAATVYTAPGAPPMKSEATASVKPLMGGRYFRENYKGEFMGREFSGIGMFGYDKGLKKYVSSWIDSMSTGLAHTEGTADASGDIITFTGEHFDPMRQQIVKTKYVLTLESRKTHSTVMYEIAADGSERKAMELVYTRVPRGQRAKKQDKEKRKPGGKKAKKKAE